MNNRPDNPSRENPNPFSRTRILGLLVLLIVAIQIFIIIEDYGLLWAKRIWRNRADPAMERSANLLLGESGSKYIDFLLGQTPPDATIAIPPQSVNFSEQNLLQFYLIPRAIVSCRCEETNSEKMLSQACLLCLQSPGYYVPAIGSFPPQDSLQETKVFIPATSPADFYRGVFAPINDDQDLSAPDPVAFKPLGSLIIDLFVLGALFAFGGALTIVITNKFDWMEMLIFSLPLGGGIYTWVLFLASWAGLPIRVPLLIVTYALLMAVTLVILRTRAETSDLELPPFPTRIFDKGNLKSTIAIMAIVFVFLISVGISVGRAYSTYDGIANWALKGYAFAEFETIFAGENWGGHGIAYPQNLPLLIATFKVFSGDMLPGSKFLFPLFTLSLVLGCVSYLRGQNVSVKNATLGGLILYSIPHVFLHSTIGFANLPFTTYLVLGTLWSITGLRNSRQSTLMLGGCMFALAAWTRPEGIGFSLALVTVLIIAHWIRGVRSWHFLPWLLPVLIIPGIWLVFGAGPLNDGIAGHAFRVFTQVIGQGKFTLDNLATIITFAGQRQITPRFWGLLIPALGAILMLTWRRSRLTERLDLALAVFMAAAVPIGLVFVSSFRSPDLMTLLDINWDRWLFPFAALATVFTFSLLREGLEPSEGRTSIPGRG
jgi:hypothetical protein